MIAAGILGLVALVALYLAFGRGLFGSSTATATAVKSPTPKTAVSPPANPQTAKMPSADEQNFNYQTTEVVYSPGRIIAPEAGRNIFAFYEPPPPCTKDCPPPPPTKTPPTPTPATPTPTPVFFASFANPQSVYAGAAGFRLEVNGDRFTPDAHIYFSQSEMPTTFINAQKLVTDVPANFIAQEGPRQIIVQTPDGKAYSQQLMITVQAPPRPTFQYIGMVGRKRYNNDTAYFTDGSRPTPFTARLNDVVGGRFKLINISSTETVFEDVSLGFRHHVPLTKGTGSSSGSTGPPINSGFQGTPGFIPGNGNPNLPPDCVPGIPCNIPRAQPPQPGAQPRKSPVKTDVDDNDDGN